MKKRLLITSIVMMLVVAVALSTATYAWFTSNAKVDAAALTLKASVSGESSLGIGWLNGVSGTSITSDVFGVLQPMAPDSLTVNSTKSEDLLFHSSSIREEDSQFVFNGGSDSFFLTADTEVAGGKTYYTYNNHGAYYEAVSSPAENPATAGYYEKAFSPLVYNNGTVQAFYVRNSSSANAISRVTVTADFTTSNAYILAKDTTFRAGRSYYTFADAELTVGASSTGKYEKAGNVYSLTADSTAQTGKTYYTKTDITVVASSAGENQVVAGSAVTANTYYEQIDGNSLIRVAIFTKPQSSGANTTADYKLLGVLGQTATAFAPAGAITAFDKNTTYYTRTGAGTDGDPYVYSQVTSAFDNGETYYTAENTAVYGAGNKFDDGDAMRDLNHYTNVVSSMTLVENLETEKQVDIVAIAWLDGTLLDDGHASVLGQVSLYFTAA